MKTRTTRRALRTMHANDSSSLTLPAIGDATSIQRAIAAVVEAVADGTLEPPRARVLLYGLQLAATNAHRMAQSASVEPVQPTQKPVASATIEAAQQTPSEDHAAVEEESIVDAEAVASDAVPTPLAEESRVDAEAEPLHKQEPQPEAPVLAEEVAAEEVAPEESTPHEASAEPSAVIYESGARSRLLAFRQRAGS